MEINYDNLQRMVEHMRTVNAEMFTMFQFRESQHEQQATVECNSVGCVVGHCVVLSKEEDVPRHYGSGKIDFFMWCYQFTGVYRYSDEWSWLFGESWGEYDDTVEGAIFRMQYLIDNKNETAYPKCFDMDMDWYSRKKQEYKLQNKLQTHV